MINNIIFSKNRAMQLDALLRSLKEYSDDVFLNKVIYTHDKDYKEGYDLIKEIHKDVVWIKEENLKANILSAMASKFTCFMVDDLIVFKSLPKIPFDTLRSLKDTCFSLRLGKNIKEPHLSYPLSVDGHVYLTEDIKPLIESIAFNNPNKLESKLQRFKSGWNIIWKYQCMVSIPHNRVSIKSHCKFSGLYNTDILERYFLDGYEIDYHRMDFTGLNNVHGTPDYAFKTR